MSCGRSSHRHPGERTDKRPLSTSRSVRRGRPVAAGVGNRRLSRCHGRAVKSEREAFRVSVDMEIVNTPVVATPSFA
jgi:hypothetical protein